jgi:hypothetical protein
MYWDLAYHQRPLTINKERTLHHHARAKIMREWKSAFIQECIDKNLPKGLARIGIEVLPIHSTRAVTDASNVLPALKAACDGIVGGKKHDGYGVVEDDSPEFLPWVLFYGGVYSKGENCLWLRVHDLS